MKFIAAALTQICNLDARIRSKRVRKKRNGNRIDVKHTVLPFISALFIALYYHHRLFLFFFVVFVAIYGHRGRKKVRKKSQNSFLFAAFLLSYDGISLNFSSLFYFIYFCNLLLIFIHILHCCLV